MNIKDKIETNARLAILNTKIRFAKFVGNDIGMQAAACEYWALKNWIRKNDGFLESASGPGSTKATTEDTRIFLERIIKDYEIQSIVDIGCGDWNWMSQVNLANATYIGYDLVQDTIEQNRRSFGHHPNLQFKVFNAITDVPETADLVIIRDVLFHLSLDHALLVIKNIRKSKSKFLMTTTFPQLEDNKPLEAYGKNPEGWGFHRVNLEIKPFELKPSIESVKEPAHEREVRLYVINDN